MYDSDSLILPMKVPTCVNQNCNLASKHCSQNISKPEKISSLN